MFFKKGDGTDGLDGQDGRRGRRTVISSKGYLLHINPVVDMIHNRIYKKESIDALRKEGRGGRDGLRDGTDEETQ